MSDRRPSKLHDPAKALEWWRAEGSKMAIVELYEAVADPVAVVRRGVESGTIKGEVVWNCSGFGGLICQPSSDVSKRNHPNCGYRLVIPVSDGGSET